MQVSFSSACCEKGALQPAVRPKIVAACCVTNENREIESAMAMRSAPAAENDEIGGEKGAAATRDGQGTIK